MFLPFLSSLPALLAALALLFFPLRPAPAAPPQVASDIAPVQGLVADVMAGIAVPPPPVLRPEASPHGGALRPSQARALQRADLVVWIGPALTPRLERALTALAGNTPRLTLLDDPATRRLPRRGGGGPDPHAWLDPENARAWLTVIADALGRLDPANAEAYAANAQAARARIAAASRAAARRLAGAPPFVTHHDAYRYFEHRFGLTNVATLSGPGGAAPGPARLAALRQAIREGGVGCAFREPQTPPGLLETALEGTGIRPQVLDPMGAGLPQGPGFYVALIGYMAETIAGCAAP